MFIGNQYPYARSWGPCPLDLLPQFHSSLSNSEDKPCSRGRDMECRSGSPGPPPWAPGGGLRGLKSQVSARVGDSHSLIHALLFLPPWSPTLVPPHQDHASISTSPGSLTPGPLPELLISHPFLGCTLHNFSLYRALSLSYSCPSIVPDSIWGPLRKGFRLL